MIPITERAAPLEFDERPSLAPEVHLLGEMPGTGFVEGQWLIRRHDRFIQVTEVLYRIAERLNGRHTLEQVATGVSEVTDWSVTAEQVRQLVTTRLVPLGLVTASTGAASQPRDRLPRSPLQITGRRTLLGPRALGRIVGPLGVLYSPALLIPLVILGTGALLWAHLVHGLGDGVRAALYTPGGLLTVLGFAIAASVFHELGHGAALQYGGGVVRGMGVGLYLVYPTFYTDVSDAYRLGRGARLRTDLGGMYFHLVFALGVIGLYLLLRLEVLLAVVMVITVDIIYQCVPYVRLDGYWALVDLAGVPDFFSQMRPFLRSLGRADGRSGARLPRLTLAARAAFVLYLVLALPTLALLLFFFVRGLPRLLALSWDALLLQLGALSAAASTADVVMVAAVSSQIALLALSMLAGVYLAYGLGRTSLRSLWRWSRPTPARRLAGALMAVVATALLAVLWL